MGCQGEIMGFITSCQWKGAQFTICPNCPEWVPRKMDINVHDWEGVMPETPQNTFKACEGRSSISG